MKSTPGLGLIVEDSPAMQDLLFGVLLDAFPGLEIHIAGSVKAARDRLRALVASGAAADLSIVLIDIGLPDGSGLDLLEQTAKAAPAALRIVATIFDDDDHLLQAFASGAQGYLLKEEPRERLVERLRNVGGGEPAISPSLATKILRRFTQHAQSAALRSEGEALTPRESEILQLIGKGLRVGEAASVLGVSQHTVSTHVKSIYAKLGISTRAEAALEASRRAPN